MRLTQKEPVEITGTPTSLTPGLPKSKEFTIQVKPNRGAVVIVDRTPPGELNAIRSLNWSRRLFLAASRRTRFGAPVTPRWMAGLLHFRRAVSSATQHRPWQRILMRPDKPPGGADVAASLSSVGT